MKTRKNTNRFNKKSNSIKKIYKKTKNNLKKIKKKLTKRERIKLVVKYIPTQTSV